MGPLVAQRNPSRRVGSATPRYDSYAVVRFTWTRTVARCVGGGGGVAGGTGREEEQALASRLKAVEEEGRSPNMPPTPSLLWLSLGGEYRYRYRYSRLVRWPSDVEAPLQREAPAQRSIKEEGICPFANRHHYWTTVNATRHESVHKGDIKPGLG